MNVGFISLGCSKNLVDTEMVIGLFKNNNFKIVNNPKDSDIIIINTCGFIESAKQEAINTILEMAEYKKKKCKYLIVIGCLVERYKEDLEKSIPEVDLFIPINQYDNLWSKIIALIDINKKFDYNDLDYMQREISTGNKTAYLKIAEGCSNKCTYCAIPYIRGPFISRNFEEILEEAQQLAKNGIKELIIIAQDTTKYGIDLYGKSRLAELLENLCKIKEIEWIRVLYAYPETITDELIQVVKENDKICKYFDIPIQHISDKVLKRMNRKSNGESIKKLIEKIRKEIPNVIIRTTLIVGFPGETEDDFKQLYEFVKNAKFDKLGVFTYSKEEGTPAEKLPNQIHHMIKKSRYNKIMLIQQEISKRHQEEKIGKTYRVLLESKTFDGKYYLGRTYMDIPEIDGVVYVENTDDSNSLYEFVDVEIIDIKEYDLLGILKKKSKYINVNNDNDLNLLKKPAKSLKDGNLVIFPTETVYGIGANALDKDAVEKIFIAKGRAQDNPLIIHISDIKMLEKLVLNIGEIEKKLMDVFWPGPLTIIMEKQDIIPNVVSANLKTVGIRLPNNKVALKLIEYAEVPIAAPSANISGRPSGTNIQDIKEELDGKVEYIIDSGNTDIGLESTVIKIINGIVHILRPGKITPKEIEEVIKNNVIIDEHILKETKENEIISSPGMKYRHYAPNTRCILIYSNKNENIVNKINELIKQNKNVLVLGKSDNLSKYNTEKKLDMGNTLEEISKNIFKLLRKVDKFDVDVVLIEGVEKDGLGLAIMNRLIRACEYNLIEC